MDRFITIAAVTVVLPITLISSLGMAGQ
jgi:hypothetical protein